MSNKTSKSPPLELVAGNGLIDRRALLGRGVVLAGALGAGGAGSVSGAAAEPLMSAETLPKVKLPNRDNFVTRFPDRI
jgi:hypothetical protein